MRWRDSNSQCRYSIWLLICECGSKSKIDQIMYNLTHLTTTLRRDKVVYFISAVFVLFFVDFQLLKVNKINSCYFLFMFFFFSVIHQFNDSWWSKHFVQIGSYKLLKYSSHQLLGKSMLFIPLWQTIMLDL